MRHQLLGALQRDLLQAVDQPSGRAGVFRCQRHGLDRIEDAALCRWMGRKDDRVAGFDGDQRLEKGGRGGVGGWNQGRDHAHRPGNFVQAAVGVVPDDPHRFLVADALPDHPRAELVFQLLVSRDAVAGLFLRQASQPFGGLVTGFRHRRADPVHFRLRGMAPGLPGFICPGDRITRFLN